MTINSIQELFYQLFVTTSSAEVKNILTAIGDYPETGLDTAFGKLGVVWHPYGDNTSNFSTIGLATKPGRSLTERLTNCEDAVLEERSLTAISKPDSPQRAASEWFGRPVSGPDNGLFKWNYSDGNYDRRVAVVLSSSGSEDAPTVDAVDFGIGILPENFPTTILSLHGGNKMTKKFLIGAFGQGGSSTLKFSDYALIVSKHVSDPNKISFTVIKDFTLGEEYKENCYAYLAMRNEEGKISALNFSIEETELKLYNERTKLNNLKHGTIIRHYGFKLTNLTGSLGPQAGNLYHFLQLSMFDPILPFRVIDLRDPVKVNDQLITGSRNRLMDRTLAEEQNENSRTELKHYRPMEYVVPSGSIEPCIGIEYWVIFNKEKTKKDADYTLRPHSNILFVQKNYPIVGTLNGQNQGELSAQLLRSVNLPLVAKHIVIHIDATKAPTMVRRGLFSTSREGFVDGPVLESIKKELERMLKEDFNLEAIEKELVERITSKETETTNDEVNRQITKLLLEAGFAATTEGATSSEGAGQSTNIKPKKPWHPVKPDPLPTLPFPQVTKFNIVAPETKLDVHLNDAEAIRVETDADAEFDKRSLIAIRFDPDVLEVASKAPLRGGRIRWRVRPKEDAKAGDRGKIVVAVTKLDGTQLTDEIDFEVFAAIEKPSKPDRGTIPPFKIIPIDPDDENWSQAWENVDKHSDEVFTVAYVPKLIGGVTHVYYSTVFTPFRTQADKLKTSSETLFKLFEMNYQVWIGYHAILQFKSQVAETSAEGVDTELDDELMERERENERSRVATMQVKQALKSAELMMKVSKIDATVV
jgi:hypothetical protein